MDKDTELGMLSVGFLLTSIYILLKIKGDFSLGSTYD